MIYFYCYVCIIHSSHHLLRIKKMEIANLISSQSIVRKLRQKARMPEILRNKNRKINTFKNNVKTIFPVWSFRYLLPQNNNLRPPGNLNDFRDLGFTCYVVASFLPELLQTASLSRVMIVIHVPHQWTSEMFSHRTWYS